MIIQAFCRSDQGIACIFQMIQIQNREASVDLKALRNRGPEPHNDPRWICSVNKNKPSLCKATEI